VPELAPAHVHMASNVKARRPANTASDYSPRGGAPQTRQCSMALVHFQTEASFTPSPKLLCDDRLTTDGIRASGHQHPIQHRYADGSLGLLSRKAAGSQPWSDQRLVTTHCRFY
jgi:hypothetical protein